MDALPSMAAPGQPFLLPLSQGPFSISLWGFPPHCWPSGIITSSLLSLPWRRLRFSSQSGGICFLLCPPPYPQSPLEPQTLSALRNVVHTNQQSTETDLIKGGRCRGRPGESQFWDLGSCGCQFSFCVCWGEPGLSFLLLLVLCFIPLSLPLSILASSVPLTSSQSVVVPKTACQRSKSQNLSYRLSEKKIGLTKIGFESVSPTGGTKGLSHPLHTQQELSFPGRKPWGWEKRHAGHSTSC